MNVGKISEKGNTTMPRVSTLEISRQLEEHGKSLGMTLVISYTEGDYYVTSREGRKLQSPINLGHVRSEATQSISSFQRKSGKVAPVKNIEVATKRETVQVVNGEKPKVECCLAGTRIAVIGNEAWKRGDRQLWAEKCQEWSDHFSKAHPERKDRW